MGVLLAVGTGHGQQFCRKLGFVYSCATVFGVPLVFYLETMSRVV